MKSLTLTLIALMALSAGSCSMTRKWFGKSCGGKKFARMDSNKDGKISRKEWRKYRSKKFKKKDANGDGYISAKEWGQRKKGCAKCAGK